MSRGVLGKRKLNLHPDSPDLGILVNGKVELFSEKVLKVSFAILGDLANIAIPQLALAQRKDNLWQQTCCEVFVGFADSDEYVEYNLSPSGDYAVYRFQSYRDSHQSGVNLPSPDIYSRWHSSESFHLISYINIESFADRGLDIGLSAIVENRNQALTYWALNHPEGRPDFHNRDCFVLKLAAPMHL